MTDTTVDNFTNDSAMMIAWERYLETKRPDGLFNDPLAEAMAGSKGETLSDNFGGMCKMFEFEGWPEFHKTWVAVRTRFIDDKILEHADEVTQLVNLGAGMDTRPYRLECYRKFVKGSFDVDMSVVNEGKRKIFANILNDPSPHCDICSIDLDFLDKDKTMFSELVKNESRFDSSVPSLFIAEGLIMYLGAAGKFKLISDVSAVAAPGSVLVLQFMDASKQAAAKANPAALENALSVEDATEQLTKHGWIDLEFSQFGDEKLNYGRYASERFEPSASFSFCVCRKA